MRVLLMQASMLMLALMLMLAMVGFRTRCELPASGVSVLGLLECYAGHSLMRTVAKQAGLGTPLASMDPSLVPMHIGLAEFGWVGFGFLSLRR